MVILTVACPRRCMVTGVGALMSAANEAWVWGSTWAVASGRPMDSAAMGTYYCLHEEADRIQVLRGQKV